MMKETVVAKEKLLTKGAELCKGMHSRGFV